MSNEIMHGPLSPMVSALGQRRGTIALAAVLAAAAVAAAGCGDSVSPTVPSLAAGTVNGASVLRKNGKAVKMGDGIARTYVLADKKTGVPVEVGIALSEDAMENLPAGVSHPGGHGPMVEFLLDLPKEHRTPYQFVELDWNPMGHGDPYSAPHFDFHFYKISVAERNAIDPSDPEFANQAANLPAQAYRPARTLPMHQLLNVPAAAVSVPRMGLHWLDVASPELPPSNQPFTKTWIVGSWNGKIIFEEPMITRQYIMAQRDRATASPEIVPVMAAQRYAPAGYYPTGYRVTYNREAKEYRIALTGLTARTN